MKVRGLDLSRLPPQSSDVLARLALDAAPPSEREAVAKGLHHRTSSRAQGRSAERNGRAWEASVFAALDALQAEGTLATWGHYGPQSKRVRRGGALVTVTTGTAPCDVMGTLRGGRTLVAEVKRGSRVVLAGAAKTRDARVEEHQRAQLEAVHRAGGVAALVVCVRDVVAVIPWGDVREAVELRDVTRWRCALVSGLRNLAARRA